MEKNVIIENFLLGVMPEEEFKELFEKDDSIVNYLEKIVKNYSDSNLLKYLVDPSEFVEDMKKEIEEAKEEANKLEEKTIERILADMKVNNLITYMNTTADSFTSIRKYFESRPGHSTNLNTCGGTSNFIDKLLVLYKHVNPDIVPTKKYSDDYIFLLNVMPDYMASIDAEKYIEKNIISLYPDTMKVSERKKAIKAKIKEEFKSEKGYPCWIQESEWPICKSGKPGIYVGSKKLHGGEAKEYYFKDPITGEIITIFQSY